MKFRLSHGRLDKIKRKKEPVVYKKVRRTIGLFALPTVALTGVMALIFSDYLPWSGLFIMSTTSCGVVILTFLSFMIKEEKKSFWAIYLSIISLWLLLALNG